MIFNSRCGAVRDCGREPGVAGSATLFPLCRLHVGETGIVQETSWQAEHQELLASYGFFPGSRVTRMSCAPQGDPLIYRLEGRLVAVRKETAGEIMVTRENK